jgi:surface protein
MKKLILLLFIPLVFGCSGGDGGSDDSNNPCPNQPQLTTLEVSNIEIDMSTYLSSATFSGEIQNIQLGANCETFSITNQGFVYSTNIQPTTSDNVVNANGENASANVSDLINGKTYYVRAYLTNTLGTFYGNEVSFTTNNPIYLAENGITIKAKDWAEVGMMGEINGLTYTIVDILMLNDLIENEEDVTVACTSLITDMSYLFADPNSDFNQDISSWDVSNVTDMTQMFNYTPFNQDISFWDVSSLTIMNYMFYRAHNFNQDISSWDVSNVTEMNGVFELAYNFNQDISNWDVSNVTSMVAMFAAAITLNQDLSLWDVSNVTNMYAMFQNAFAFNQDLSSWNVNNVSVCIDFCLDTEGDMNWTLPKPNFTNCGDTGCN